jgi:MYXO-CTERM domain-containing protein
VRQVAFGDVDGDGDADVFVPAAGGTQADALFVRQADGSFADEAATRLPAGLSSDAGATRLGDVDNDGDLDLIVADGYINDPDVPAHLYLNDGAGNFVEAPAGAIPTAKNGVNPDDIDLADVDGDFDLDVYINLHSGPNLLWINDGHGVFTDASAGLPPLSQDAQFHYGPVFCDVDGDGDRDLFIDNTADGYTEQLLINNGSGDFTDETAERVSGNVGADDNLVACLDYDGDGDLDFVVGALSPGLERLFQNDGTGHFTPVQGAFSGQQDPTLWMEIGDLNGDGRLDAFTAQGEGNPQLERVYFGNASVAADTRAPTVVPEPVALSASAETVVRFAVADGVVSDEGPRLRRAWIEVGDQQIDARFIGGDLYRAVIPATSETTFAACAADWAGNTVSGCEGSSGTGGGGQGGGGQGGGGQGGSGQGSTSSTTGSGGTPGGPDVGDDDGCGCGVPGEAPTGTGALLVALGALSLATRRRRSR